MKNVSDVTNYIHFEHPFSYCEAQGKGRAKGRLRKVTQRSFIDGGWWMVDILSLELTLKLVATRHHHHHPPASLI